MSHPYPAIIDTLSDTTIVATDGFGDTTVRQTDFMG